MNPLRLITLTIKQTIKKPAIIGLLLIMPLIAVVIKHIMPTASDELRITALYYLDADNDETEDLYDALEMRYSGINLKNIKVWIMLKRNNFYLNMN